MAGDERLFAFGAVMGGPDAAEAFRPHIKALRGELAEIDATEGPDWVRQIKLKLFVGGEITPLEGGAGSTNIRAFRNKRRVTGDLRIPRDCWVNGSDSPSELLRFALLDAVRAIATRVEGASETAFTERVEDAIGVVRTTATTGRSSK